MPPPETDERNGMRAELRALTERVDRGFADMSLAFREHKAESTSRCGTHREATTKIDERLRGLELEKAKSEGSNYDARLLTIANRTRELEKWRWYLVGALALGGAALAGGLAKISL